MLSTDTTITHFFTKVSGVTYPNSDGSSRQEVIQRCCVDEQLYLEPEPDNPYDPNAVRVVRETDEQVGYLPAQIAEGVAGRLRDDWAYVVYVNAVLLPDDAFNTYGLELLVVAVPSGAAQEDFQRYMDQLQAGSPA